MKKYLLMKQSSTRVISSKKSYTIPLQPEIIGVYDTKQLADIALWNLKEDLPDDEFIGLDDKIYDNDYDEVFLWIVEYKEDKNVK